MVPPPKWTTTFWLKDMLTDSSVMFALLLAGGSICENLNGNSTYCIRFYMLLSRPGLKQRSVPNHFRAYSYTD